MVLCVLAVVFAAVSLGAYTGTTIYPTGGGYSPWKCKDTPDPPEPPKFTDICRTDNSTLTDFKEASVSQAWRTAINATLSNSYAPTDLTVVHETSGDYHGGSETDIIYQVKRNPGGQAGIAWCNDATSDTVCDQHYIRFAPWTTPAEQMACHETGHAVGLVHGPNANPPLKPGDKKLLGCMIYGQDAPQISSYGASEINRVY